MMDMILMIWSSLLMVTIFTSYLIIDMAKGNVLAFFPIVMLCMGIIFMFLVNRQYYQTKKAKFIFQKGYEKYVFVCTYIALFLINISIILGVYKNISLGSPIIMSAWLLPMVCYSLYQSVWLCFDDAIHVKLQRNIEKIEYKKIKKIKIITKKKNKCKIIIITKKAEFTFSSKKTNIIKMKEYLLRCNKDIVVSKNSL